MRILLNAHSPLADGLSREFHQVIFAPKVDLHFDVAGPLMVV
jgi:hypothetical protein